MLRKIKELFFGKEKEKELSEQEEVKQETEKEENEVQEVQHKPSEETSKVRPLTPAELEMFKKGMGITPHNYWTWAGRTKNFKLLTDGKYVWVEGYEDHIGKQLPLTQQRAWSWDFIKQRLRDFGSNEGSNV